MNIVTQVEYDYRLDQVTLKGFLMGIMDDDSFGEINYPQNEQEGQELKNFIKDLVVTVEEENNGVRTERRQDFY